MLTELSIVDRRIELKKQAVTLIVREIKDLKLRKALTEWKSDLESQIDTNDFDPVLSRKLDAITILLED